MIAYLRSALFWLGFALSAVVIATSLIFLSPLPFRLRQRFSVLWPRFSLWWLRWTCGLRHEVVGAENIPAGAAVYACKHQSAWETVVMETVVPPMVWVLKRELMWIPIFGWGLAALRPIAINRSKGREAVEQMLSQGAERLAHGISVAIFPEGTRVEPGQPSRYRAGAALLAVRAAVPVVPMAHNAGYYWPRRGFVKRPGVIKLVIGAPIQVAGQTAEQITQQVRDWIEATVADIGGPDQSQVAQLKRRG